MKKFLSVFLASLVLLLAGCGVSDQDIKESIPTLTLTSEDTPYSIPAYSYSWTVTDRWGNGSSMAADTAHPLDAQEDLTITALTAGAEVALEFSKTPDSVSVVYWSADETDYENSTQLDTQFLDGAFHFTAPETAGQMVFSITGLWNSYDDISGTVTYCFTTAG